MADEIRVDYAQLQQVATRFARQATAVNQTRQQLQRKMGQLQSAWIGKGSSAFYAEMSDKVLPATERLYRALLDAGKTTQQVAQLMRQAEEDAAAPFRTGAADGPGVHEGPTLYPPMSDWTRGGGSAGPTGFFWDNFKFKGEGDIWEYDFANKDQPSKFDPELRLRYGVSGAMIGDPDAEGFSALGGSVGWQLLGWGPKGWSIGPYAEGYAAQAKTEGVLLGDESLGLTGGITGKAIAADGFAGLRHNTLGAAIGGTLVSVEGELGANVAGINVGLTGEVGLKAELGFQIGEETELKLPFVTVGFRFGGAKKPDGGVEAI